jgi:hypothetical protein
MAKGRLNLRVPARCKSCAAAGTVTVETTVSGLSVLLRWCCRKCGHDWPISARELLKSRRRSRKAAQPKRRKSR